MKVNGKVFDGVNGNLGYTGMDVKSTTNFGATFVTTTRQPLESWKIWPTVEDAKAFVMYTGNDAAAYVGMVLTVTSGIGAGLYVVKKVGADAGVGSFDESAWVKIGVESNDEIIKIIEDNEKIVAGALTEMNNRIEDADSDIDDIIDDIVNIKSDIDNIKDGEITIEELKGAAKDSNYFAEYQFKKGGEDYIKIGIPGDTSLISCEYISQDDSDDENAGSLKMIYLLADGSEKTVYVDISETMVAAEVDAIISNRIAKTVTKTGADKDKLIDSKTLAAALENVSGDVTFDESFKTSVAVGGLDKDFNVTTDMTVKDILIQILASELKSSYTQNPYVSSLTVKNGSTILATNSSNYVNIVEVGTTITPTITGTSTTGEIGTYNGTNTETHVNAGCSLLEITKSVSGAVTSKGSGTYTVNEGDITFTYNQSYSDSTVVSKSNKNNNTDLKINAGTATASCKTRGAYKIWYGNVSIVDSYSGSDDDFANFVSEMMSKAVSDKWHQGWTNGTSSVSLLNNNNKAQATNGASEYFYLICPSDFILYGTQSNNVISAIYDDSDVYTYKGKAYKVYAWLAVNQTYLDVKMVTRSEYVNLGGKL